MKNNARPLIGSNYLDRDAKSAKLLAPSKPLPTPINDLQRQKLRLAWVITRIRYDAWRNVRVLDVYSSSKPGGRLKARWMPTFPKPNFAVIGTDPRIGVYLPEAVVRAWWRRYTKWVFAQSRAGELPRTAAALASKRLPPQESWSDYSRAGSGALWARDTNM